MAALSDTAAPPRASPEVIKEGFIYFADLVLMGRAAAAAAVMGLGGHSRAGVQTLITAF